MYNIYIAFSFIIAGLIVIISVISVGIINWSLWIAVLVCVVFILIGSFVLYKNRGVFGLDKLEKYGDKTSELYNATEKKLYKYLGTNIGKAFTTKALLKRVGETIKNPNFKKYVMRNGEKIPDEMVTDGRIQSIRKNEDTHYFLKGQT
ncbi:MAG: hypothetical protein ACFFB0_05640 [Promethearchaeota archaeon]